MTVLCIKEFPLEERDLANKAKPSPYFLEECIVLQQKEHCGAIFYQLGGRFDRHSGFRADHFAILPDTTADEMSEESKEAIVNIETPII